MTIFVVDDEPLAVESLKLNISKSLDEEARIVGFSNSSDVLAYLEEDKPDIVFLDIEMPGMNGVNLASTLKNRLPGVIIIFVTAYNDYALKAWELRVDGYLLKPASVDDIATVLRDVFSKRKITPGPEPVLDVQCFGKFEAFANGEPVRYKRSRAKEVLAYLVAARGAGVSSGELCGALWEDNSDIGRQKTYLRQYVQSLRESLDRCGAGEVLIHNRDSYSVDTKLIECDYYRYLSGETDEGSMYHGEFMSQYSWADEICAELDGM